MSGEDSHKGGSAISRVGLAVSARSRMGVERLCQLYRTRNSTVCIGEQRRLWAFYVCERQIPL